MGADDYLRIISSIRLDLLELFGSGYVIDYCVSILSIEAKEKVKEREERFITYYLADCLRLLTENTAKMSMTGDSTYITRRLYEIMEPKPEKPQMTADEIVVDVLTRGGMKLKGGGEEGENVNI